MRWLTIACMVFHGFFSTLSVSAEQTMLERLIPKELESKGWKVDDEPFIAFDEATLSMLINGAAPRYIKLGTRKAAFVNYKKQRLYLMLEIYETASEKKAAGLFDAFATEHSAPLENLGTRARLTSEMGGSYMVEYYQDRFFVRLSIMKKSEAARKSILECAYMISDGITDLK